jgi:hypothetical protein
VAGASGNTISSNSAWGFNLFLSEVGTGVTGTKQIKNVMMGP